MPFTNTYEDAVRAAAYADLEFPGTYYLAFRGERSEFREAESSRKSITLSMAEHGPRRSVFLPGRSRR
jgi:hypothetical protein